MGDFSVDVMKKGYFKINPFFIKLARFFWNQHNMIDKKVFIMGSARSGSKIFLNILEKNSNIAITPEMKFWVPWKWEKCVIDLIKDNNFLQNEEDIKSFIEQLWNAEVDTTFWHLIRDRLIKIDKKDIISKIFHSDKSFQSIFKIFIESYREFKGKEISGAQYPLHPYYYNFLINWFPNGKFLHLCREPRANLTSFISKRHFKSIIKEKFKYRMPMKIYEIALLSYGIFNYYFAAKQYKQYKNDNILLCKFEEFIKNPEISIKNLCNFLKIDYKKEMLNPPVEDSSYEINLKKGFDKKTLIRWKERLSPLNEKIIISFTNKPMKIYGYK